MRALILLALIGAAFAAAPHPDRMGRIVGGQPTSITQFPFMANIQYLWYGLFWVQSCGGTLITTRSVLSAAHCFDNPEVSNYRVLLGTTWRSSGGIRFDVESLIVHEEYGTNWFQNDVAILVLRGQAPLSDVIQPARLAGHEYTLPDGTPVKNIGWGHTASGGSPSEQLQYVEVNTINQELCHERYAYLRTLPGFEHWGDVTEDMICTGILDYGGKDACQGDSGGPVTHDHDVVVGVVSWGYRCADPVYPGINARVSYLVDWIVKHGTV